MRKGKRLKIFRQDQEEGKMPTLAVYMQDST